MNIPFTPWPAAVAQHYRDKGYWAGVPLFEILSRQSQAQPDALAIIDGDNHLSYAQLKTASERLAAHLEQRGINAGDTALIQLPNQAMFYIVFFALLRIGVVPVNALYSHQRLELEAFAKQIQPRLLIASHGHPLFRDTVFIDTLSSRHQGLVALLCDLPGGGGLEALIDQPAPPARQQPSPASEVAFFQLSGGSTGTPKLIPRTHDDYFYSVRRSAEICRLNASHRFLCALPAAHNYPLSSPGALGFFHCGAAVVLAPSPEPLNCMALIEQHQVTHVALVPSALALWLDAAAVSSSRLHSLELLQVGGASLSEALARRVPAELGCALQQVFGMAEGMVAYTSLDDGELRYASQGYPMSDDDEVRVYDAFDQPVAHGQVGMLATRGPYTIRGYFQSPEHNARVFDSEGFYHTGDLVRREADGRLTVVGRTKDQINRGGEKIAAEEVEHLICSHPQVRQAALMAYADALMGEKSCAVLVGSVPLTLVQLRRYLREQGIAEYKLPDRVEYTHQLPLTPVGKIDKRSLRQQLAEALS